MEVMEAIRERRSIRKYSAKPIEEEKLNAVLEAARLSPSATNAQEWRFIVVRDQEKLQALMDAAYGQKFVGKAPAAIIACGLKSRIMACNQPTDTVDLSIALSFMILEAVEQGLGTCWLGRFSEEKVKQILDIPEHVRVIAMTPIGYSEETPEPRERKSMDEIVSFDTF